MEDMPRRKAGDLTIKERNFVKKYVIEGKTKKAAALESYKTSSGDNASQMAKRIIKRPVVREYIQQMLDRKGLSLEDLGDKMHESIDKNLRGGKPSQAVAADLMKFSYKLQDAVPANKSLNVTANIGDAEKLSTSPDDLIKALKELTDSNMLLVKQFEK